MPANPIPTTRVSVSWALRAALLCAVGLVATWVVAELVPATHVKDAIALHDFTELSRPRLDALANALLGLLDPAVYAVWGAVLVGVALARGRARVALAAAIVLPLAPLSAEVMKPLLAHAHEVYGPGEVNAASWPSGHSTAAMSLALCAVLVSPRQLRPAVAALGAAFAIAVGFSLLLLAWHMPSDVFGGYLLAACWSASAVAALLSLEERRPSETLDRVEAAPGAYGSVRVVEGILKGALLLGSLLGAAAIAAFLASHRTEAFTSAHLSLVVAAGGIATLAALLSSALVFALRR